MCSEGDSGGRAGSSCGAPADASEDDGADCGEEEAGEVVLASWEVLMSLLVPLTSPSEVLATTDDEGDGGALLSSMIAAM